MGITWGPDDITELLKEPTLEQFFTPVGDNKRPLSLSLFSLGSVLLAAKCILTNKEGDLYGAGKN